jgi:hypothetical protein
LIYLTSDRFLPKCLLTTTSLINHSRWPTAERRLQSEEDLLSVAGRLK